MDSIGIDLGTTNSLIAVFEEGGPRLIANDLNEFLTPSVVGLADDRKTLLVGKAAKMRLVRHPELTTARFKRLMGTNKLTRLGTKSFSAVELSAMVLRSLRRDAETDLGRPVTAAVISVPAYFNSVQRQATKDAAEIAGLKVLRLVNEPTAAALAAGLTDRTAESTIAVLDLGGGTFDVSILQMFEGVMEVRASSGDAQLGGEDFTARIAQSFAKKADLDWQTLQPRSQETLLAVAEDLKRRLDGGQMLKATATLPIGDIELSLDQERFAEMTADLMARMRRPINICLNDTSLSVDDIDRVLLVGGATRMPEVRSLAAKMFRKLPERSVDPDHAIALGAAVQAGLTARHTALDDVVMTDVAPFSLGIPAAIEINGRLVGDRFVPIIERNTILPASRTHRFSTVLDNQTDIELRILQGEAAVASDNVPLGVMHFTVPRGPKGRENFEVRFTYDVSGLLAVDVQVLSTGRRLTEVIDNLAAALSPEEKAKRLATIEAFKINPRDDAANVALIETLKHLYEMLIGEERIMVQNLLSAFEAELERQDPRAIAAARAEIGATAKAIEQSHGY